MYIHIPVLPSARLWFFLCWCAWNWVGEDPLCLADCWTASKVAMANHCACVMSEFTFGLYCSTFFDYGLIYVILWLLYVTLWWFSYPSISGASDISLSARSLCISALEVNIKAKRTKHTSLRHLILVACLTTAFPVCLCLSGRNKESYNNHFQQR